MKEEIVAGIKNALDRNEPLDKILQSFINAGYNRTEVEEVAKLFQENAMTIVTPQNSSKLNTSTTKPAVIQQNLPKQSITPTQTVNQTQQNPISQIKPQSSGNPFSGIVQNINFTPKPAVIQQNLPKPLAEVQINQEHKGETLVAEGKKGVNKTTVIILSVILLLLITLLGGSLLFKKELIGFIESLTSAKT